MKDRNDTPASVDGDPIVQGLRRLYDSVASEPVPAEFMDILRLIDQALAEEPAEGAADATKPDDQIIAFRAPREAGAMPLDGGGDIDVDAGVARDAAARQ